MAGRETLAAILFAALVVACQPSAQPGSQRWSGESVTVFTDEGVQLCGGTLPFLDRYVSGIGRAWTGAPWDGTKDPLSLELRAHPSTTLGGQATHLDRAWVGQQASLLHEVVHLVTGAIDGQSAISLREGTAEAFGSTRVLEIWGDFFYAEHPEEFVFLSPEGYDGESYYPASGQTTAALTRRYGIAAVRRAYQLAPRQGSSSEIEAAYAQAFGDGIYDTFDEIAQEQPCGLREWQCDPDVVPAVSLPFGFTSEQTAACGDEPGLIGAALSGDESWYPEAVFAFEFEEETTFVYEGENAFVYGFFCRDTCEGREGNPPDVVYPYSEGTTTLPAGRYFFRIRSGDRVNPFSFRFDPA